MKKLFVTVAVLVQEYDIFLVDCCCCRVTANCPHVGPGPKGVVPSVGGLSKGSLAC